MLRDNVLKVLVVLVLLIGVVTISVQTAKEVNVQVNSPQSSGVFSMQGEPNPVIFTCKGNLPKICSIRLSTIIGGPEEYREVLELLDSAHIGDVFTFHLIGNGGQVRTLLQLHNALKYTKADTIGIVEGDVYSAHADLAISMKRLIIRPNVNFLFHRSSIFGEEDTLCLEYKGKKDRHQDQQLKCESFIREMLLQDYKLLDELLRPILTGEEFNKVLEGHDVIIHGDVIEARLLSRNP